MEALEQSVFRGRLVSRTLVHPGPFNPIRITSLQAQRARHFRMNLVAGLSLFDALIRPLQLVGVKNASTTIIGVQFERLSYCVAPPDPSRSAVIAYTKPICAGKAYMMFGNATIGNDGQSNPIVHCHAAIRTSAGSLKGGHIITHESIIGQCATGVVLVTTLDDFDLQVAFDPETNISLLQPIDGAKMYV